MSDSKDVGGAAKRRPPNAGVGRKKGVPNKVTADVKAMVLQALSDAGGSEYLLEQANKNPGPFLALVGKVIPKDLNVSGSIEHKAAATEAVAEMMRRLFNPPGGPVA